MRFCKVEISQFRNLISTSFFPSPSLNLIYGSNGSGKSSLLEAIHFLATGSSFRTHRLSNIINTRFDCFTLFTEMTNTRTYRLGIKRCTNLNNSTRLDGREVPRRSELVQLLPLQVISPESIALLIDGSEIRRNYLDWSLFHVEQSFHHLISSYSRALKQRNALLKNGSLNDIELWEQQLVEHGEIIDRLRDNYLHTLIPIIESQLNILLPDISLSIQYRSGWNKELSFGDALQTLRNTDLKMKHTTVGPHRADVQVKHSGVKAVESLSRGQLKLVVVAFKLAQLIHLTQQNHKRPIILLDDLAAELDNEHRQLLLEKLRVLDTQIFVTTPDINLIQTLNWEEKKVFHVEHGQVEEVV